MSVPPICKVLFLDDTTTENWWERQKMPAQLTVKFCSEITYYTNTPYIPDQDNLMLTFLQKKADQDRMRILLEPVLFNRILIYRQSVAYSQGEQTELNQQDGSLRQTTI